MKTWRDVQEAALYDPVLQSLVSGDARRAGSREQLLIEAVLELSRRRQRLIDELVESKQWQSNR